MSQLRHLVTSLRRVAEGVSALCSPHCERMALFASSRGSGAASRHYVEFRAGKMTLKNRTLTADKRKGQVFVWRAPNEGFIHFCWKDRTTGRQEDVNRRYSRSTHHCLPSRDHLRRIYTFFPTTPSSNESINAKRGVSTCSNSKRRIEDSSFGFR